MTVNSCHWRNAFLTQQAQDALAVGFKKVPSWRFQNECFHASIKQQLIAYGRKGSHHGALRRYGTWTNQHGVLPTAMAAAEPARVDTEYADPCLNSRNTSWNKEYETAHCLAAQHNGRKYLKDAGQQRHSRQGKEKIPMHSVLRDVLLPSRHAKCKWH